MSYNSGTGRRRGLINELMNTCLAQPFHEVMAGRRFRVSVRDWRFCCLRARRWWPCRRSVASGSTSRAMCPVSVLLAKISIHFADTDFTVCLSRDGNAETSRSTLLKQTDFAQMLGYFEIGPVKSMEPYAFAKCNSASPAVS